MSDLLSLVKSYFYKNKILFLLFLAYLIVRLPFLNQAFLLRGERDIVLTGYSLLKTGKDLYGNILPTQFFGLDQPSPLLSFYFSALSWFIFPIRNVFFSRLPFVLASSLNIFFVYELVRLIVRNKKLALLTTIIFNFSPGYFHLSMLALEINIAMPLLLAGMICYLKQKKFIGWILFGLSFFAYNGFRPLIPFVILYLEFFYFLPKKNVKKWILDSVRVVLIFFVLFAITYLFIDGKIMSSRSADLIFLNYDKIAPLVDFRRNTSVAPTIVNAFLNNKITNTLYYIFEVLFEGISLDYLFFSGDRAAIYASTFGGQFFAFLLPFYFLGFVYFGKKWDRAYVYMLGFIPVALIPSLVNIDYVSIAIRSLLASVSYAFVISCGIVFARQILKTYYKKVKFIVVGIVGICIFVSSVNIFYFSFNYIFRRPVTMFESFFEHERTIAKYIHIQDETVTLYDDSPKNILTAYFIQDSSQDIQTLQSLLQTSENTFTTEKVKIIKCPNSGEKNQMYNDGIVIAESCLDPEELENLNQMNSVEKLPFIDFSGNTAFFVYKSTVDSIDEAYEKTN